MALPPRMPHVALIPPQHITPGSEVELVAELFTDKPLNARSIDVTIEGQALWKNAFEGVQGATVGGYYSRPLHVARVHLHDEVELSPGRLELPWKLLVPGGLPSGYSGSDIEVSYTATVRVDVPWRRDIVRSIDLPVVAPAPAAQQRPTVVYSKGDWSAGREPYFELSLGTTELVPGTELELTASFGNVERNLYRVLEVELLALENRKQFLAGGTRGRGVARSVHELSEVREGEPIRIQLSMPDDLVPGFDLPWIALDWQLRVQARAGSGRDAVVEIPVTIHPAGRAEAPLRPAPEIGARRVAALWQQVASEHGLAVVGPLQLRGTAGGAPVNLWRASSERGAFLVGEIDIPDLRIGLSVERRGGRLRARDKRHQQALSAALAAALEHASVVSASDRRIRCEVLGEGDHKGSLAAFLGGLVALAGAIEQARAALPPPERLEGEMAAWRDAAGALGARLEEAGPSLIGSRDGLAFAIGVAWSEEDEPSALETVVGAPIPIDQRHQLRWEASGPRPDGDAIARACAEARSLEIDRTEIRAEYALEGGVDLAASQLPALAALTNELCRGPGGGAYR